MQIFINFLTISRILLGIIVFLLFVLTDFYLISLILFMLAGVTDYLDGYLARKYNYVSVIGEILDPIADKILIVFLLFAISIMLSSIYVGFASSIIISREIWVGALRDFCARNQIVNSTKVTFLAKVKTTIQLFSITLYLLALALNNMLLVLIEHVLFLDY